MTTRKTATEPQQDVHTTVRMPQDLFEALKAEATRNERKVSGELRLAVRHWVAPEAVRDRNGGK